MKKLLFIMKKLPLLSLILFFGVFARLVGSICALAPGSQYHFLEGPIYSAALGRIHDAAVARKAAEQAETAMTAETATKQAAPEPEEPPEKKLTPEEKLARIKVYVSAKKEAKITKKPLAKIKEERKSQSEGTYIFAKQYPKSALIEPISAVSYGVCDGRYTDPLGTTYDYLNEEIFKQDNDYYSFREVDDSYFANALFIGDSLSDGLHEYGDMKDKANFFSMESLTVYSIFDVIVPYKSPTERFDASLEGILSGKEFRKIYILLGMNEMGVPATADYREQYKVVLRRIRALQPGAIIYIQGIFHVSKSRSDSDVVYNNDAIIQRNQAICKLANGHDIFYIEPTTVFCDQEGNMYEEYTNDGVHPTADHYPLWHQYLKEHAIVRDERDR